MTVITVTTVGFGEVQPMTTADKLFMSILILTSLVIVGYALSVIAEYLLSKDNLGNIREKRMLKKNSQDEKPHDSLWLWPQRQTSCRKA
ncbi:MAG: voltage-gated potassium channel [Planctomycetota bacterium]|jgi:voltage-gated potassium channel|uniref:potassium channel family protein n=1 Tax=Patiriisocius sp. Uisw_047 TaxID=3230969 RepID=UPI0039EC632E